MSVIQHSIAIKKFILSIESIEQISKIQLYLLNILKYMHANQQNFELDLCLNSPFYKEFVSIIEANSPNDDNCFALLECIIVFCREKQLTTATSHKISPAVQELLYFYENSDFWNVEDGTLLHTWYWHTLPSASSTN